jgi:hypothetical protein
VTVLAIILGLIVFVFVMLAVIWGMRQMADVMIGGLTLVGAMLVLAIGMAGGGGFLGTLVAAVGLGIAVPLLTMPLWQASSFFRDKIFMPERRDMEDLRRAILNALLTKYDNRLRKLEALHGRELRPEERGAESD